MVSPCPVNIKSIYARLLSVDEVKLPVVTNVNDLARLDVHFFTYPEVEIRVLQLPVVRDGGKNSSKIGFDIPQQEVQ